MNAKINSYRIKERRKLDRKRSTLNSYRSYVIESDKRPPAQKGRRIKRVG